MPLPYGERNGDINVIPSPTQISTAGPRTSMVSGLVAPKSPLWSPHVRDRNSLRHIHSQTKEESPPQHADPIKIYSSSVHSETTKEWNLKNPNLRRSTWTKFLALMLLIIPSGIAILSVAFGAVLAEIEDCAFEDGFWLVATILTTSTEPLGGVVVPTTPGGKIFTIVCGTWGMGLFGLLVVIFSSPAMTVVYHHLRLW